MEAHSGTRRRILESLYGFHREDQRRSIGARDLMELLGLDDEEAFYEDLQYLHDEDYVEGPAVPFEHKGYLKRARITQKGADLIDNPEELERLFPVDRPHARAEEFVETLRQAVNNSDIPADDKETILEDLARLLSRPGARDILAGALAEKSVH
jgi:hypothetical protein